MNLLISFHHCTSLNIEVSIFVLLLRKAIIDGIFIIYRFITTDFSFQQYKRHKGINSIRFWLQNCYLFIINYYLTSILI